MRGTRPAPAKLWLCYHHQPWAQSLRFLRQRAVRAIKFWRRARAAYEPNSPMSAGRNLRVSKNPAVKSFSTQASHWVHSGEYCIRCPVRPSSATVLDGACPSRKFEGNLRGGFSLRFTLIEFAEPLRLFERREHPAPMAHRLRKYSLRRSRLLSVRGERRARCSRCVEWLPPRAR